MWNWNESESDIQNASPETAININHTRNLNVFIKLKQIHTHERIMHTIKVNILNLKNVFTQKETLRLFLCSKASSVITVPFGETIEERVHAVNSWLNVFPNKSLPPFDFLRSKNMFLFWVISLDDLKINFSFCARTFVQLNSISRTAALRCDVNELGPIVSLNELNDVANRALNIFLSF